MNLTRNVQTNNSAVNGPNLGSNFWAGINYHFDFTNLLFFQVRVTSFNRERKRRCF